MLPFEGAAESIRAAIRDHLRALLVAVQFLTRLPTPRVDLEDEAERRAVLGRATAYFPAVGALIGVGTGVTILLAGQIWPMGLAVVIGLVFEAVLTGAFHEDAVADFCDAFGGGWTRDDVLRILKDSRIGSFGALGLGLAVVLRGGSLAALGPDRVLAAATASASLGRWAILPAMWALPPLAERESISRDVGQQIGPGRLALGTALAVPGCLGLALVDPVRLALGLAAVMALTVWLVVYVRRRLGGITGDCLGFLCYAAQVMILLLAAGHWPSGVAR
jgi:adenosylcobinamide-GDP ribazoletransferase